MLSWIKRLLQKMQSVEKKSVRPVAWSALAGFLEELEHIGEAHEEIYDTQVRELLWEIVDGYLLKQTHDLNIPTELGMFSPDANETLKAVLERELPILKKVFDAFDLDTEAKRNTSFFNPQLQTESGRYVDDFFGHP
ncbi:hypothetical protein JXQ70_19615 [bacterium]|nr:hypothetical protein [bacterium]